MVSSCKSSTLVHPSCEVLSTAIDACLTHKSESMEASEPSFVILLRIWHRSPDAPPISNILVFCIASEWLDEPATLLRGLSTLIG